MTPRSAPICGVSEVERSELPAPQRRTVPTRTQPSLLGLPPLRAPPRHHMRCRVACFPLESRARSAFSHEPHVRWPHAPRVSTPNTRTPHGGLKKARLRTASAHTTTGPPRALPTRVSRRVHGRRRPAAPLGHATLAPSLPLLLSELDYTFFKKFEREIGQSGTS